MHSTATCTSLHFEKLGPRYVHYQLSDNYQSGPNITRNTSSDVSKWIRNSGFELEIQCPLANISPRNASHHGSPTKKITFYCFVFIEVYVEVKLAYTWILSNIYLLSTSVTIQLVILGLLAFFQETQII